MERARRWFLVALLATSATGGCRSTRPQPPTAPAVEPPPGSPPEPELVTYAPGPLRGFIYRPAGPGPFPVVVFNHGSEQTPGSMPGQAEFYLPHGFVLFVPHRRGQGQSAAAGPYIIEGWQSTGRDPGKIVELLDAHADDVAAAVAYVRKLPYVDPERVAVAGCSFGGIETLLVSERDLGLRAAIDFAGGAIIWAKTPPLQERMKRAARASRIPVFFMQAENDFDTAPSRVLSEEMRRAGRPMRMKIFPATGTTALEGHGFCGGGPNPAWGPEVLEFLGEHMPPHKR